MEEKNLNRKIKNKWRLIQNNYGANDYTSKEKFKVIWWFILVMILSLNPEFKLNVT